MMAMIRHKFMNSGSNRVVLRCLGCGGLLPNSSSPRHPRAHSLQVLQVLQVHYDRVDQRYKNNKKNNQMKNIEPRWTHEAIKVMNLCVIGTGKSGTARSLLLRIGEEGYLFNCGEGTARTVANRRLYVGIKNIFFTHLNWTNLSGVIGVCLTIQSRLFANSKSDTLGLHGPASMQELFTHSRTFSRFHRIQIESQNNVDNSTFENDIVHIESVIFYPKFEETKLQDSSPMSMLDLALYMKAGQSSRSGENEAVFYIITPKPEELASKRMMVVECPNEQFLQGLVSQERLKEFYVDHDGRPLDVVMHLSPLKVTNSEKYQQWIRRFNPQTKHLMINEGAPENPISKSHALQGLLSKIDPEIWPMLSPAPSPPYQQALDLNMYRGSIGLFYSFMGSMAGKFYRDRKELIMVRPHSLLEPYRQELKNIQSKKDKIMKDLKLSPVRHHYPEVVFLGTAATRPTDIRNVTSILVHLSPDKAILMDCGESTYEQMVSMYGLEEANNVLRKIKLIYITHMHPDHHLGLVSILHQRHELHCKDKVNLVGPMVLSTWMDLIDTLVTPVQHMAQFIAAESFIKRSLAYTNVAQVSLSEMLDLQELDVFRASHSQHPSSIAITHNDGWKLVYSGDTNPGNRMVLHGENCDVLIHEATYPDERLSTAIFASHCTVAETVDMGVKTHAKHVLLTHLMFKYNKTCLPDLSPYEDQLQLAIAFDFMRVKFWQLPLLSLYQSVLFRLMNEHYRYGNKLVNKMKEVYTKD